MTNFSLKCETFVRLANICDFFNSTVDDELKRLINCIRLENKNGLSYAVATNKTIAAVEFLGENTMPDCVTHVKITPELIAALKKEIPFDSTLSVTLIPEMSMSVLTTVYGYSLTDCSHWYTDTPLNDWRDWIAPEVKQSVGGAMYWDLFQVESLIKSSPSGRVVFPEFIDAMKPVLLKDISTDNWRGVFIPSDASVTQQSSKPKWWK